MNLSKPICGIISVALPLLSIPFLLTQQSSQIGIFVLMVILGFVFGLIGTVRRENHELLCAIGMGLAGVFFFGGLAMPVVTCHPSPGHGRLMQVVNNGRQIYLATFQMATDGMINKDSKLAWPGDLKANGTIATVSDFATLLVRNGYLFPVDLRVFSGPGFPAYQGELKNGVLDPPFEEKNCVFKIFLVKADDLPDTVFLMSKPGIFKNKGVVIVRKGGDAASYKNIDQAKGSFKYPGNTTEESAENCLNP